MCSIFGVEGKSIPEEKLRECFDRTISRGPDMSRFVEIPRGGIPESGRRCESRMSHRAKNPSKSKLKAAM